MAVQKCRKKDNKNKRKLKTKITNDYNKGKCTSIVAISSLFHNVNMPFRGLHSCNPNCIILVAISVRSHYPCLTELILKSLEVLIHVTQSV